MAKSGLILGTMTFGESLFSGDAKAVIKAYINSGYDRIDTAYVYNEGKSEEIIGEALEDIDEKVFIDTKVNPRITGKLDGQAAFMQLNESLKRLKVSSADTFYLHFPDPFTPVESVLSACNELYLEKKFSHLGLSNFPVYMIDEVFEICEKKGYVSPDVYEGMYNPLTRKAEGELKKALDDRHMAFRAYNPAAGGILTGRYSGFSDVPSSGRFVNRKNYMKRYWKQSYFDALNIITEAAGRHGIPVLEAVFRWLRHHSMLNIEKGDAVILGVSRLSHLNDNTRYFEKGPLPCDVVFAFDRAWELTEKDSPEYFTLYKGAK